VLDTGRVMFGKELDLNALSTRPMLLFNRRTACF
jgi:hypothetical protein